MAKADGDLGGEDGSGGCAVDGNVVGAIGFENFFVDSDGVIDIGRELVLGREAVENGNDLDLCEVGDGDGFGERAGIGVKAAAVQIDEDAAGIHAGERGDDADGNAGEGALG